MTKSDVEKMVVGKTLGECSRFLKQYNYKMLIVESDGVKTDIVSNIDRKTCCVIVQQDKIVKASFKKDKNER